MFVGRTGPKKLAQKYTWGFLAKANLAHTKIGPDWSIGLRADPLLLFNLIFVKKIVYLSKKVINYFKIY